MIQGAERPSLAELSTLELLRELSRVAREVADEVDRRLVEEGGRDD
jgi:hypothetical protein